MLVIMVAAGTIQGFDLPVLEGGENRQVRTWEKLCLLVHIELVEAPGLVLLLLICCCCVASAGFCLPHLLFHSSLSPAAGLLHGYGFIH